MERITPLQCRLSAEDAKKKRFLPEGFALRPCAPDDLEVLLKAGQSCFAYNAPTRPELRHALTKGHTAIFALEDITKDRVAGYVFLEGHMARKNLYINTVALLEEYRGKGLGGALYSFAESFAAHLGAKGLWCHTAFDNAANISLIKKMGYELLRREESYYDDGRACLVFEKRL